MTHPARCAREDSAGAGHTRSEATLRRGEVSRFRLQEQEVWGEPRYAAGGGFRDNIACSGEPEYHKTMSPESSSSRKKKKQDTRKARGLLAIRGHLPSIAEPAARKRGFTQVRIITEWPVIVGEMIAAGTIPEKLVFRSGRANGILYLRVTSGLAVRIQHLSPQIMERVNTFFGYSVVRELRYKQGPIIPLRQKQAKPPRRLTSAEEERLDQLLEAVENPSLRDSLHRLGKAIRVHGGRPT